MSRTGRDVRLQVLSCLLNLIALLRIERPVRRDVECHSACQMVYFFSDCGTHRFVICTTASKFDVLLQVLGVRWVARLDWLG